MKKATQRLIAALLAGGATVAAAQAPAPTVTPTAPPNGQMTPAGPVAATPAGAAAAATPAAAPPRRRGPNDQFRPRARHLLYVTLPGSLERSVAPTGTGIVVLDANNNYAFVKRIPTWNYPASMSAEQVAGVAASPVTNMIYVSARGRLGAWDLATDKMVWTTTLDGKCCERPQITPDGKYIIVGSDLQNYWFKLDAKTGKLIAKIEAPDSWNAHNLNLSADGKTAFMSPNGKIMSIADVATAKQIKTIPFPENVRVFVINKDGSKIYSNQGSSLGFVIADVKTGKIEKTVDVTSVDWRSKWNTNPRPRIPHGCPSHGIALTPDEKEIWLADGIYNKIRIFSNDENPREIDTIDTPDGVYWMTFGLDAKLAYVSSGDIIDIKTHKIVGTMKDDNGNKLFSEKLLDMTFDNGHLQRVSNQFGNSFGDYVTAEQLGVGPHVSPIPGNAPFIADVIKDPNAGMKQVID